MLGKKSTFLRMAFTAVMASAMLLVGCDSDDVTGPIQSQTSPPVNSNTSNSTWTINVSADPAELNLNDPNLSSQIVVSARRSDNNQAITPGTTALLSTTAGTLTTPDGNIGDSVPITFDSVGQARATLNPGVFTSPGSIIVRAQIESSFGSVEIRILDVAAPPFFVTNVTPSFGPPSGGTNITINGSGFEAPARVVFNGDFGNLPLTNVRVAGSTRITATTPQINLAAGANAIAAVTVENAIGLPTTATDTLAGGFTYTRSNSPTTLKLFSLSPTSGPNEGGTRVTIRGEGFGREAQVFFSGGPRIEATVLSITSTQIEVLTPSATGPNNENANTLVSVEVTDPATGGSALLVNAYQYGGLGESLFISAVSPNQVEYLGGDLVTIFGQGFDEPVAVSAGGIAQQVISVSGTEILFRSIPAQIGCAIQSGLVSVTNIETNESTPTGPDFQYIPIQPQIFGVTPNSGGEGQTVTINGAPRRFGIGFDPPVQVSIGGNQVSNPQLISGTEIRVVTPSAQFEEVRCCPDGSIENDVYFNDVVADVLVTNTNTGCSDTFVGGFVYSAAAAGLATQDSCPGTCTDAGGGAADGGADGGAVDGGGG